MGYEFLEHTADVKFRSYGENLEDAFENASLALKEVIVEDTEIKEKTIKEFSVEGKDKEALLREFLEEFLYLLDAENFIFSKIKVLDIEKNKLFKLKVKVIGDNASNYNFSNPVKAVTYNDMEVKTVKNGWMCQVVLDV